MKRIIPILAALCLVLAMAVPALAVESDTMVYNGVELPNFDNIIPSPETNIYHFIRLNSASVYELHVISKPAFYDPGGTCLMLDGEANYCRFELVNGTWVLSYNDIMSGTIVHVSGLLWANYDILDFVDRTIYFSGSDPVHPICDGSACMSVDSDGDGFCDDCGGFFTPPPPGPLVEAMTQLKEQNQLSQVLTQVVTMIPIGLACWVGYKGLRKGLDLLQRILHQA